MFLFSTGLLTAHSSFFWSVNIKFNSQNVQDYPQSSYRVTEQLLFSLIAITGMQKSSRRVTTARANLWQKECIAIRKVANVRGKQNEY